MGLISVLHPDQAGGAIRGSTMEGQQSPAQSQGGPGSRCDSGWSPQVVSSLDPQALLGGHLELQTLPWGWDQQCSSGSPLPGSVFTVSCLYLTVALARTALRLHACACARLSIPLQNTNTPRRRLHPRSYGLSDVSHPAKGCPHLPAQNPLHPWLFTISSLSRSPGSAL